MVYHRLLNIVLCAMQQDVVVYAFYTYKLTPANPKLPLLPFSNPLPLGNHKANLYVCDLFLFEREVHLCRISHGSDAIW